MNTHHRLTTNKPFDRICSPTLSDISQFFDGVHPSSIMLLVTFPLMVFFPQCFRMLYGQADFTIVESFILLQNQRAVAYFLDILCNLRSLVQTRTDFSFLGLHGQSSELATRLPLDPGVFSR